MKRRFECTKNGAYKFWNIWTQGFVVFTEFGIIGSNGQINEHVEYNFAGANAYVVRKITEKLNKGYVEVTSRFAEGKKMKIKVVKDFTAEVPVDELYSAETKRLLWSHYPPATVKFTVNGGRISNIPTLGSADSATLRKFATVMNEIADQIEANN